jgi:hypothetical protein
MQKNIALLDANVYIFYPLKQVDQIKKILNINLLII